MKKTILVSLVLFCGVILAACGKKADNEEGNTIVADPECVKVVQDYLAGADMKGEGEGIKVGDNIVVDYIGRLKDGTVFDTSIQSVAEACGTYSENRDYTEGLPFEAGAGQMIKGFDNGVIGMKVGQTKTVEFGPEEGYGAYDNSKVERYTSNELGDLSQYEVGMYLQKSWYEYGVITEVTNKEVVVDFNDKLAGKDLIFDITVKSIN